MKLIPESLNELYKFIKDDSIFNKLKIGNNPFNFYKSKYYMDIIEPNDWDYPVIEHAAKLLGVDIKFIKVLIEDDLPDDPEDTFFLPFEIGFDLLKKDDIIRQDVVSFEKNPEKTYGFSSELKTYNFLKSSRNLVYITNSKEEPGSWIMVLGTPDILKESINFERSGNPIKKMGIGKDVIDQKIIEETDWYTKNFKILVPDFFERAKPFNLIRDYKDYPILVYKITNPNNILYSATSTMDDTSAYDTPEEAIKYMKAKISKYIKKRGEFFNEDLNFNRQETPFKKMGIGKEESDRQFIKNTTWNLDIGNPIFDNVKIIKLIRNYKGFPLLILKNTKSEGKAYYGMSLPGKGGEMAYTAEEAEQNIKSVIDWKTEFNDL